MKLQTFSCQFELLTDCFCGGVDSHNQPAEMRPPSIRGMVRFWHRASSDQNEVSRIWGSTSGDTGKASLVKLTVRAMSERKGKEFILPHNEEKSGARRPCLAAGAKYELVLTRMPHCSEADWRAAQDAVKLWLLVGCLGLRSNRAAGSVWPLDDWAPSNEEDLKAQLKKLKYSDPVCLALQGSDASELRHAASNTVSVEEFFGKALGGREPSPIKFKVINLDGKKALLITAPGKDHRFLIGAKNALSLKRLGKEEWKKLQ